MALVGNSHVIAGNAGSIPHLIRLLEKEGVETSGNADIFARQYAHFGVDEAREIRDKAALKGQKGRRVFIAATPVMTAEAQNALLKTLEEPSGGALFFLIVPAPETLLPTLLSRMQRLRVDAAERAGALDERAFISSPPASRLEMLKPLLEKGDDDRRDIAGVVMLLSSLERMLEKAPRAKAREGLGAIYRARKYMLDKGSLVKPLLEQVALLVPVMKA